MGRVCKTKSRYNHITMAGIYVHIPFCRKACVYCDFHFSTQLSYAKKMIDSICQEMHYRKGEAKNAKIETLYFGGGTPSLLSHSDWHRLFSTLKSTFAIDENAEITVEANPDDLNLNKLDLLRSLGVNRLSIGIQSFVEEELIFFNRSHNSKEAIACLKRVLKMDFKSINVDLIYGNPHSTFLKLKKNLAQIIDFGIPHISAYVLTVEPNTVLSYQIKKKKTLPLDKQKMQAQFELLKNSLAKNDYVHYELSNFAKPGHLSKHNSNYWNRIPYLGFGPSAHSYSGNKRKWNVKNNALYIQSIKEKMPRFEEETLSIQDRYNEYIMTGLRTMKGINLNTIENLFGNEFKYHVLREAQSLLVRGALQLTKEQITISDSHQFLSDGIVSQLFYVS